MKIIILGPQCSGKTTLKRHLEQKDFSLPLLEEDGLFVELNMGTYPGNVEHKEKVLRPQLQDVVRNKENVIFLTSYCDPAFLKELKDKSFKVIQLVLDKEEFKRRNEGRIKEEGYDDANIWEKHIFNFHERVRTEGLIDKVIDATLPVEQIADQIFN